MKAIDLKVEGKPTGVEACAWTRPGAAVVLLGHEAGEIELEVEMTTAQLRELLAAAESETGRL